MIERFQAQFSVDVIHAWGMTETGQVGTSGRLLPKHRAIPAGERAKIHAKQGRAIFGVDLRIVDDKNRPVAHDGVSSGRLEVRGPWVVGRYFGDEENVLDENGFFDTGDIACIDHDGFLQITDRAKDLIKSGGEWISSIDIAAVVSLHPDVREAAVVGIPHPKWQERPLLIIVPHHGRQPTPDAITKFLSGKIAKWWLPDDVVVVERLPLTATGRVAKRVLRDTYSAHRWPSPAPSIGDDTASQTLV